MEQYLTKSKFRLALECPTKLFYTGKKEYYNAKIDDQFLKALAKGGFQIGELAKHYYLGGTEVTEKEHDAAIAKTNKLLENDCTLYEAAFKFETLFVRTDILIKRGKELKLIEVKAKSFDANDKDDSLYSERAKDIRAKWKPYLYDVAFQKHVLQQAFPEFKIEAYLLLVDKTKQASVEGLNQKFLLQSGKGKLPVKVVGDVSPEALGENILIEISVDELIDPVLIEPKFRDMPEKSFAEWVRIFSDHHINDKVLRDTVGSKCAKCEFVLAAPAEFKSGFRECWKAIVKFSDTDFDKPSVLTLYDSRRKNEYISEKKYFLENLTRQDLESSSKSTAKASLGLGRIDRQELQISKAKNKERTPYIDKEGLKAALSSWNYPLHFIDFETTAVALPFNKGRRPYEQIAFQYSHHTLQQDGTVKHEGEWLNDKVGQFPNFEFVRRLRHELKDSGSIFRYASHENSVLNAVYRQLKASEEKDREELCEWIKTITKSTDKSLEKWEGERNMIDLKDIVAFYYYHPLMEGSYSIKTVLPAILESSDFLKLFYNKPVYGSDTIKSSNFKDKKWIQEIGGKITDPYDLLPPVFEGINSSILDSLILAEDTELSDGGAAMIAYAQMQFTQMSKEERARIRTALLQYCELDTLAMLMIAQEFIHQTR